MTRWALYARQNALNSPSHTWRLVMVNLPILASIHSSTPQHFTWYMYMHMKTSTLQVNGLHDVQRGTLH